MKRKRIKHPLSIHETVPGLKRIWRRFWPQIRKQRLLINVSLLAVLAELAREARILERSIGRLELYRSQLGIELGIERDYRHDYQRPQSGKARVERLLAQGPDHGLPRDVQAERAVAKFARTLEHMRHEQEHGGGYLNVRIFREEERDRGMGF